MAVTIKEIASRAGVSPGVVSTVINGANTNIRVSEKTRAKVLDAARDLNYRPNLMARGLRKKRTGLVGVVTPRVDWGHWPQILQGMENILETAEYSLILCTTDEDSDSERRSLTLLRDKGVDGVIAVPAWETSNVGLYAQLAESKLPLVCVARQVNGINCPFIYVDGYKIGAMAAEHLLSLGHRRVGLIGRTGQDVYQGFRDTFSSWGVPIDESMIIPEGQTMDVAMKNASILLRREARPSAIYATKDIMGIAVMKVARALGLSVPEDLSVLGSDDHEIAALTDVPLSSVGQPKTEQGSAAASVLLKMIEGQAGTTQVLDPYLAVRESTAERKSGGVSKVITKQGEYKDDNNESKRRNKHKITD